MAIRIQLKNHNGIGNQRDFNRVVVIPKRPFDLFVKNIF